MNGNPHHREQMIAQGLGNGERAAAAVPAGAASVAQPLPRHDQPEDAIGAFVDRDDPTARPKAS